MSLKIGFETFSGGSWKTMEFKDNSASHLKYITVGSQDLIMRGTMKQCVNWLKDQDKPVKVFEGFGDEVWIILRGIAAKPSEEIAKAYGSAFGVGGIAGLCFTGVGAFSSSVNTAFQSGAAGELGGAIAGLAGNSSDINLDNAIGSVIDKVMGKKVVVRISCAKGCYKDTKEMKDTVIKLQAGLSSRYAAAALSTLKG